MGDVHAVKVGVSIAHVNVTPGSVLEKTNVALLLAVTVGGPDEMMGTGVDASTAHDTDFAVLVLPALSTARTANVW